MLATKPRNGFRVIVLGESSVFGSPYGPSHAFPAFLQRRLAAALPDRRVEVVNAGIPAASSWLIRWVAEEIADYKPDVVILYAGHNEFLNRYIEEPARWIVLVAKLRVLQLAVWASNEISRLLFGAEYERAAISRSQPLLVRDRVDGSSVLDDRERERVTQTFLHNLDAMAELVGRAGAMFVVATVGQNFRGWEPGTSRHRDDLTPRDLERWQRRTARGDALRAYGHCRTALRAYRSAARIDDQPASLHFAMARCLDDLGESRAAAEAYRRASDLDGVPLGVPTSFNRALLDEATRLGVPSIDVARELDTVSAPDAPGDDLFVDFIHPSLLGHERIGQIVAGALRDRGLPAGATWQADTVRDPDPETVLAEFPDLRKQEHYIRSLIFQLVKRYDDAERERAKVRAIATTLAPRPAPSSQN